MANILQITTPIAPKDYQLPNRQTQQLQNPDQVFNLGDQTQIVKTNDRTEDYNEQNLKDTLLNMPSSAGGAGGVSSAIDMAKELLGKATLAALRESGNEDTLNKLTEFAEEVILSPEKLMQDLVNQQEGATIYGGKMWDALRSMLKTLGGSSSEDLKAAITDFAKASANNAAKGEILDSLSANFKFLSEKLAPSKAVADELMKASEALKGPDAARNFLAIKSTLVQLVNYTNESLLLDNNSQNLLPLIIHNMSRYSDNPAALKESFSAILNIFENMNFTPGELQMLAGKTGAAGADINSIREALAKLFDKHILSSDMPQEVKNASLMSSAELDRQNHLESMKNLLTLGIKNMSERLDAERLKNTLSGLDPNKGTESVKLALASMTPNTPAMADALDAIIGDFEESGDLQALVDRLADIIDSIEDMDKKFPLAQSLNSSLEVLAEKQGVNYKPPTSMDMLADFLVKNLNDKTLQSMISANRSDMVQSMLTSPGVFSPLIHIFAPLDAFGMRAFAEMWIDRNADKSWDRTEKDIAEGGGETSHLFMCFDMEDIGYFELEMYAKDTNLSVMLLTPEGMERTFAPLKAAVPRIAANSGYTVGTTIVEPLYQKRNLNSIFPQLNERRGNLNAKA
ncbi:MAG: hypothetical protein IJ446_06710 [Oscillospiraceae bacterium]|nr:hypothetical protein [Oscillospiraceae bacterium]